MNIPALTAFVFLSVATVTFADNHAYNGPDNPIIPADNDKIRLDLAQCIEDTNEVMTDNENHDLAKDLCKLRAQHQTVRQHVLKGLAELVDQYKGVTNHEHDQNLAQTISLIQRGVKLCLDTLASQEVCHNIGCATQPEADAILCDNQAMAIINRLLGRE
ncbi:Uncharacterised protein [Legionella steigerwaltii]|uniref:Secreted protein n=1 Tax=Legionella steigerwaltii TaxID=460 RepID=A0A378LAB7_9GAMM|nr:hypothetical protein [Legionella steigerwaltii]KTD77475.1 hypothetical protein Lstg_1832 [Legionella steigerwaltii]STY22669.1 Uncharacterised protein [Legionella steigerwaltii]